MRDLNAIWPLALPTVGSGSSGIESGLAIVIPAVAVAIIPHMSNILSTAKIMPEPSIRPDQAVAYLIAKLNHIRKNIRIAASFDDVTNEFIKGIDALFMRHLTPVSGYWLVVEDFP